jgi:flavin-dependent dehydrogenase
MAEQRINATEMQQGDVISFYGGEFVLGHVSSKDGVYWATGVCKVPSDSMISSSAYFPFDPTLGGYTWQFQGNDQRYLFKVEAQ